MLDCYCLSSLRNNTANCFKKQKTKHNFFLRLNSFSCYIKFTDCFPLVSVLLLSPFSEFSLLLCFPVLKLLFGAALKVLFLC